MRRKNQKSQLETRTVDKAHFQKMCLGKSVFWTMTSAMAKAARITEQGHPMRAYECPNCKQWHLTSKVFQENTDQHEESKNAATKSPSLHP